jgi:hypothetical protein
MIVWKQMVHHEYWYGCNWSLCSSSWTVNLDSPNSCRISHEILHGSCSTAAIISFLAGVCTVHGQPAFICTVGIRLPVSWRRTSNHRNVLISSWWPGYFSIYSCAEVPARLFQVPRVKSILHYLLYVCTIIIWSRPTPSVHCVSWVHLTMHYVLSRQVTLLWSMLAHLMVIRISKTKRVRTSDTVPLISVPFSFLRLYLSI